MSVDRPEYSDPLRAASRVHCVGVAGTGMSGLALLLADLGKSVSGCDLGGGPTLHRLRAAGLIVHTEHGESHVQQADLVIRSAAVGPDNPDLRAARERGTPVCTHAQALGALMKARVGLAVAGTHGKTTTSAMLAWILAVAGLDPTLALGGESMNFDSSARLGRGPHLVAEADEYQRRFLELKPHLAIITNVEVDHLDYYRDLDDIKRAFVSFAECVDADGSIVTCADAAVLEALDLPGQRVRYGYAAHADWSIEQYRPCLGGGCEFVIREPGGSREQFGLALTGSHNASNATAAVAAARWVGVSASVAREALRAFRGTRRRFEWKGTFNGIAVFDDYAHHPTEIRATLAAAKEAHPGRVVAVFQPHTTNRTAALLTQFAASFSDADEVVLLPIFQPTGREADARPVTSGDIAAAMPHPHIQLADSLEDAARWVRRTAVRGDMVLTLGAGDVYVVGELLLERLAASQR